MKNNFWNVGCLEQDPSLFSTLIKDLPANILARRLATSKTQALCPNSNSGYIPQDQHQCSQIQAHPWKTRGFTMPDDQPLSLESEGLDLRLLLEIRRLSYINDWHVLKNIDSSRSSWNLAERQ